MMNPEVADLLSDSGPLRGIGVDADRFGRIDQLELHFDRGVVVVTCDIDTDEVLLHRADAPTLANAQTEPRLEPLLGSIVTYAWLLTNHRNYVDGFQFEMADEHLERRTFQLMVAASSMTLSELHEFQTPEQQRATREVRKG